MPFGSKRKDGAPGTAPEDGDGAMQMDYHFQYDGPEIEDLRLRTLDIRVHSILKEFTEKVGAFPFSLTAGYGPLEEQHESNDPRTGSDRNQEEQRPVSFTPVDPLYSLDQVILPQSTFSRLLDVAFFMESTKLVFDEWNLRSIEPRPSLAVNFRGPPGTGKTMAAHGLARHLQRKILLCRLSDLESKFHGDGPKNLVELFKAVRQSDAVLFMDEAESLLSRRFAQPEQAAESAINSMRTELLMALDSFEGITIFASNLPHSYDPAIESRLWNVDFELPDEQARRLIWKTHLPTALPTSDLSLDRLAAVSGVTGRDIKQAVISAALSAARQSLGAVPQYLLEEKITAQAKPTSNDTESAVADTADIGR
jgi:ATPase family protein associated with various cellular activities (AAA)